jgi:hypothetical protein
LIARGIVVVLPAIDFDDKLRVGTKEIDDEVVDRVLTTEAETSELLLAQARPEALFRVRRRLAKAARDG